MSDFPVSYDFAVHPDHLIHWTGKDIDQEHQPRWYSAGISCRAEAAAPHPVSASFASFVSTSLTQ